MISAEQKPSAKINGRIERRKHPRTRAEGAVELIWKDELGQKRFECASIVDHSLGGVAVSSPQPIEPSSYVILRAPGIGIVALCQVRSCFWSRTQYQLGARFLVRAALEPGEPPGDRDHHELLRAGVSATAERVDDLYRALAFRFHPDNLDTGNPEVFLQISEAYRILSASRPHQLDLALAKPFTVFSWREQIRELNDKKVAVLGVLCQRRMSDYRNSTVSPADLESLTGLTSDEVGFILWYLREKGAVTLCDDHPDYAISAVGVDMLEVIQSSA